MISKGKHLIFSLLCAAVAMAATGCGGVNASHGVSPASMLIPGLISAPVEEPSQDPAPQEFDETLRQEPYQLASK